MRPVQPLYAHIRIEDYNRRLVGDRLATGLRLIIDSGTCLQSGKIDRRPVGDWSAEIFDANDQTYRIVYVMFESMWH